MELAPITCTRRLLNAKSCIAEIFGDSPEAPSLRWWQYQMQRRMIPYYKIGHLVWFDPTEVRAALEKNCRIAARGKAA